MRRRSSSSALASSSASAAAAPQVQLQQQAEFEDQHGHLRRSTMGMKKREVNSEPSSPCASVSYASSSSSPTGLSVCHRRDIFHLGAAAVVMGAQLMVGARDEATAAFAAEGEETLCNVGEPLGRILIGLYGRLVPHTVKNFKAMITRAAGTSYAGTIIHGALPGQYIQGGRQGSKDKGEVFWAFVQASRKQQGNSGWKVLQIDPLSYR
ncbi:unnamed protein product [Calypogeia fissa]